METIIDFPHDKSSGIAVVSNAIPQKVCTELVEECILHFSEKFYEGPTLGGLNRNIKNCMDFNFNETHGPNFKKLKEQIDIGLSAAMALYVEQYPELYNVGLYDTGYRLQRYFPRSGFYRSHIDGSPWSEGKGVNLRVLGVVMYLNTVESGGGTWFPMHDTVVPAKAGNISIFPAYWTHPHQGCVPISGDKWIISTFMVCKEPFKPFIQYDCLEP
jgi:hypothetical protein